MSGSQAQAAFLNSHHSGNSGGCYWVGGTPGAEPTVVGPGLPGKVAPGSESQCLNTEDR